MRIAIEIRRIKMSVITVTLKNTTDKNEWRDTRSQSFLRDPHVRDCDATL